MNEKMPRIEAVSVEGTGRLSVKWRGKTRRDIVNLPGWIATGGKILAPLTVPTIFSKASVGNYGAAIVWDDGDLAIEAAPHAACRRAEEVPTSVMQSDGKNRSACRTLKWTIYSR